jgi:hypothetical protein
VIRGQRIIRLSSLAACALCALIANGSLVFAQCAMCRTGLNGSPEAIKVAERFNFAVFVLLIPPVLLFCGFFLAIFRFRRAQGEAAASVREEIKGLLRSLANKLRIHRREPKQKKHEGNSALA